MPDIEPETPAQRAERLALEATCAKIGRTIGSAVPPGAGFVFLLFDFGEKGNLAYISSAERADMIKLLRELITKLRR